jgi:ketosteroid isomerase-like protein
MSSRVAGWMIRWTFTCIERGHVEQALKVFTADVHFVFPGKHSFAANLHGRDRLGPWLSRLAAMRPRFDIDDVMTKGPPWNMRVAFRVRDEIRAPDGFVYRNVAFEYATTRWSRISSVRVFLDTQAVAELDQHLSIVAA